MTEGFGQLLKQQQMKLKITKWSGRPPWLPDFPPASTGAVDLALYYEYLYVLIRQYILM